MGADAQRQGLTHVDQLRFSADRSTISVGQSGRFGGHGSVDVQDALRVSPEQHRERGAELAQARLAAQASGQQAAAQPRQGLSLAR